VRRHYSVEREKAIHENTHRGYGGRGRMMVTTKSNASSIIANTMAIFDRITRFDLGALDLRIAEAAVRLSCSGRSRSEDPAAAAA
jgi:hypothetical protein